MTPGPNPSADHGDRTPADQAGRRDAALGREVLAGLVERVTFHNPETGFCVLRIKAALVHGSHALGAPRSTSWPL